MKKTIQILLIAILTSIVLLLIVLFFNPFDMRTKLIGSVINSYLSNNIENYSSVDKADNVSLPVQNDSEPSDNTQVENQTEGKHPLLNEDQEKTLESFGVNVEQLPSQITPGMEACFVEKLGAERAGEIAAGATPGVLEFFKAKGCIGE